jgi:hypothetical protein
MTTRVASVSRAALPLLAAGPLVSPAAAQQVADSSFAVPLSASALAEAFGAHS